MLRETLKQEIDTLSENQLIKLAELLRLIKVQTQKLADALPFWHHATPAERAQAQDPRLTNLGGSTAYTNAWHQPAR